jgi:hypothetical protein
MADVAGKFYSASRTRQGVSVVSPGFESGEPQNPLNPPGTDAGNFVPYQGAVADVDLGDFNLKSNQILLDTTPVSPSEDQGAMYWDVNDNAVAIVLNGYVMKVGEDVFFAVKNQTGSTITKGTACGFAGTVGSSGRLLTKPYLANGSESSTFFMGVAAENILDGEDGKVLWFGRIRGLNTNAFDEGDILYVSTSSAGGFQTTVPQAPNNIIQVAAVITKSTNQGTIFVRPTIGSNINKDEGVRIDTPLNNDVLKYNSTSGLWENAPETGLGNFVSYTTSDDKNENEKQQARTNIGSTSSIPQIITTSGAVDDLTITSNNLVFTGANVVISGIIEGLDGQEVTILNLNATNLQILNQSTLSSANNRIIGDVLIPQFSVIRLKYRTTTNRWIFENIGINDFRFIRKNIQDSTNARLNFQTTSGVDLFIIDPNINNPFNIRDNTNSFNVLVLRQITGITRTGNSQIEFRPQNSGKRNLIRINDNSNTNQAVHWSDGTIFHQRSTLFDESVRRDELPFNYPQTVATSGIIDDLGLSNEGVKLLVLTNADELTGVVPVTTNTGRELKIESRVAGGTIIRHDSASSTAANRFSLPSSADFTINQNEIYTFIYTNARWRRVL